MELGGIAMVTLLGMLACPLLILLAALGRFLPWRSWVARLRGATPWRV